MIPRRQSAAISCRELLRNFNRQLRRETFSGGPHNLPRNSSLAQTCIDNLAHRKRPRSDLQIRSRWIASAASSNNTTDEWDHNGENPTVFERFDSEMLKLVPEMLDFFDASVVRKWRENMAFERRIQNYQKKNAADYDNLTTLTAPHLLKDVAPETKGSGRHDVAIEQPSTVATATPATRSSHASMDILTRTTEEPEVIQVAEHISRLHQQALLGNGVMQTLVLLRTLQENNWLEFDHPEMIDKEHETSEESAHADVAVEYFSDGSETGASAPFMDMVEQIKSSRSTTWSTKEANTFLARLAVSPELLPDEVLTTMMETYLTMKGSDIPSCQPDAVTFEILILTFCRRFSALPTATDIVHQMRAQKSWNPKALEAAALLCEMRSDHSLAVKLLDDVDKLKDIPGMRFFRSLINVAKADDNRHTALRVLRLALENPESSTDLSLDKILVNAIQWRTKNRHGKAIDNTDYIDAILRMLESNVTMYAPGFNVWRELILMGSNGAQRNPGRYRLVDRAFSRMELCIPRYYPDYKLIKHGLDASRELCKPALAANIILHAIEHVDRSSAEKPAVDVSPMPGNEILKAMEICVQWNDSPSCGRILSAVESINLPEPLLKPIYFLGVLGYARRGDSEETERIMFDMQQRGMVLEDKFYGALMLCYAMSKQMELAQYLMRSIESGDLGVEIGPAVYDGYVLACVMCQDWDSVIAVFQRMKPTGLHPPSASSCHGVLLAGYRQGRTDEESKMLLEDLLASGAQFNREAAILSFKILLPDWCRGVKTVSAIRSKLRANLPQDDEVVKEAVVQLIRSLRIAEMEEERGLPCSTLTKAGSDTWTDVMKDVLRVMDVLNDQNVGNRMSPR